ncbi:MAG: RNA-binding cell elongation regulator Jag/EloR [Bilifractor sp.]|jgi:spoIIIJ-associated protein
MEFREFSAKTVDDAITKACIELGISSDRLDIHVISEGSTGFLGIGSKPAVIQVRKKEDAPEKNTDKNVVEKAEVSDNNKTSEDNKTPVEKPEAKPEKVKAEKKTEPAAEKKTSGKSVQKANNKKAAVEKKESKKAPEAHSHHEDRPIVDHNDEEIAAMKTSAKAFLDSVFKAMDMPVEITMDYSHEDGSLNINLEGKDMGILIGKRGQTLDSLQYLVSLVVNKEQKNYVRVKLDTEDYRRRRKETLENLARNIAYKVKRTHHSVSLEAMNPYERRIIHSALQDNKYVETHSEGNEPYRYVVVTPKKNSDRFAD